MNDNQYKEMWYYFVVCIISFCPFFVLFDQEKQFYVNEGACR